MEEQLFQFHHSLPIPVATILLNWNDVLVKWIMFWNLPGNTDCDDFFRMNMDKHLSWPHQNQLQHDSSLLCTEYISISCHAICPYASFWLKYTLIQNVDVWWVEHCCKKTSAANVADLEWHPEGNSEASHKIVSKCSMWWDISFNW